MRLTAPTFVAWADIDRNSVVTTPFGMDRLFTASGPDYLSRVSSIVLFI